MVKSGKLDARNHFSLLFLLSLLMILTHPYTYLTEEVFSKSTKKSAIPKFPIAQ